MTLKLTSLENRGAYGQGWFSPQGAYFPSQKPLSTVRGKGHKLLFVKLSQQIHNKMSMLSSEETMLMTEH